jgi:small-conductance mechanosensitive channel
VPTSAPPDVEQYAPSFVQSRLPFLVRVSFYDIALWQWIGGAVALAVALLCGYLLALVFSLVVKRLGRTGEHPWRAALVDRTRGPIAALLALGVFAALLDRLHLVGSLGMHVSFVVHLLAIAAFGWLALRGARGVIDGVERELTGRTDDADARSLRTQLVLLNRMITALIVVLALAAILSQFEGVRQIGVSLLASAGIAGVVVGVAAQRSLGTLFQGIQLSIAQPIRIGDLVVMENELGRVEQIHLTYVVLRLWDLRRLIVPIGRFLEQPFQNWTRVATNLRGTVELFVDYSTPVGRVREEFLKLTRAEPSWDGDICTLLVTDSNATAVKLRGLVSARNPDDLFDLRCSLREKMIAFLQRLDDGYHLPVARSLNLAASKAMSGNPTDTPGVRPADSDAATPTG